MANCLREKTNENSPDRFLSGLFFAKMRLFLVFGEKFFQ